MAGEDIASTLLSYARSRNVSKLVIGKSSRRGWRRWFSVSLAERLSGMASDVDVYVVGYESDTRARSEEAFDAAKLGLEGKGRERKRDYVIAALVCALTTGLATPLITHFELTNIVMLYLLSVLLPTQDEAHETGMALAAAIAQWVFDHQQPAGFGTNTLPGSSIYYIPLKAPMRTRGVLALAPSNPRLIFMPEQHRLLETFAAQIGLALERVHFVEVAQSAIVRIESERLRNSILSAISHDLRTPLTSLVGLSSTLATDGNLPERSRRELAEALLEEAMRMSNLVNNLLDMARLQAGEVQLNRQWHVLEEIVGSALRSLGRSTANHDIKVSLDTELPLIYVDSVLIERVLCNLIENATKYTPPGSRIRVSADTTDSELRVAVTDNGPGLRPDMLESAFDKFTRGEKESTTPGVGLGLAICKVIARVHRGRIWAENISEGGARFTFTLPLDEPPSIPEPQELNGAP
jgi:Osmosensitive K+ channel histidine kinase